MEELFPNSNLSSRTRFVSDHVPVFASASTRIPKSTCFRFENAWLQHGTFKALVTEALS
jgi:hypothetical protein